MNLKKRLWSFVVLLFFFLDICSLGLGPLSSLDNVLVSCWCGLDYKTGFSMSIAIRLSISIGISKKDPTGSVHVKTLSVAINKIK